MLWVVQGLAFLSACLFFRLLLQDNNNVSIKSNVKKINADSAIVYIVVKGTNEESVLQKNIISIDMQDYNLNSAV